MTTRLVSDEQVRRQVERARANGNAETWGNRVAAALLDARTQIDRTAKVLALVRAEHHAFDEQWTGRPETGRPCSCGRKGCHIHAALRELDALTSGGPTDA